MKILIPTITLLGILLIQGCKKEESEPLCEGFALENPTTIDTEEYQIINAVLEYSLASKDFIHVVQKTQSASDPGVIKDILDFQNITVDSLLLADYTIKNEGTQLFDRNYFSLSSVKLVNSSELDCLFKSTYTWESYYRKYPSSDGYYSFSRPAISHDGERAIIEHSWLGGLEAGAGYIIVLVKESGSWRVTNVIVTWVA